MARREQELRPQDKSQVGRLLGGGAEFPLDVEQDAPEGVARPIETGMAIGGQQHVASILRQACLRPDPFTRARICQDHVRPDKPAAPHKVHRRFNRKGATHAVLVEFERPGQTRPDVGTIDPSAVVHSNLLPAAISVVAGHHRPGADVPRSQPLLLPAEKHVRQQGGVDHEKNRRRIAEAPLELRPAPASAV